ncbi:redoxin [Lampropedia cohaerens]|uniref:Redoxin n=1 Tax=Lampropedia cohaerens TaxID=1610491 RepID=A0A0U1Q3D2_9BURK|nr:TlpA disulfide reductase family protein [Lampropedia cohaerens]KKW69283.1 redoxin [Lampropedia cohaerens]
MPVRLFTRVAAALLLAVAGYGVWHFVLQPRQAPQSDFVLLDGSRAQTSDWQGKVLLVNFWATSCTSCVAEMPALVQTYEKYQARGLDTVAVAMAYDPPAYVVNFAHSRQLPFKVALDNTGALAKDWGDVQLTPTTYVVDRQGSIVKRYVGPPDFGELHTLIEQLLQSAA